MIKVEIKYELGHSYNERWEQEPWHCPACGRDPVWMEQGAGDYYEGPPHLCAECGWTWTMPRIGESYGWQDMQRLAAIRASRGTPTGTSTSSDSESPKNVGSKPETEQ